MADHALIEAAGLDPALVALSAAAPYVTATPSLPPKAATAAALPPWAPRYARALTEADHPLTLDERRAAIAAVARVPADRISLNFIKRFQARPDFQALVGAYAREPDRAVREALADTHAPLAGEAYRLALVEQIRRLQVTPEAADLRPISALVAPALNRVAPERAAGAPTAAIQVNITLSSQRRDALDAPPIEVEATHVALEPSPAV